MKILFYKTILALSITEPRLSEKWMRKKRNYLFRAIYIPTMAKMKDDSLLRIFDVKASRGDKPLFQHLSFTIRKSASLCIVGDNGIGKTTLLKVICGLLPADEGSVHRKVPIHFVGHNDALPPELTIYETFRWYAFILGGNEESIDEALDFVSLTAYRNEQCSSLSMGQRRLCCMATLLISKRPLWILDEPFAGLGTKAIGSLIVLFNHHLAAEGGLVFTDHQKAYRSAEELRLQNFCC